MSGKNAKKMIMIPESEYSSLMNLLTKTGAIDSVQSEKAKIETDMESTLRNPKLSEETKALKYQSLFKKRRKLKHAIDNKPTNVFVTNQEGPSITTGTEVLKDNKETTPEKNLPDRINRNKNYTESPRKKWYNLDAKYFDDLKSIVENNRVALGISEDGKIQDYKNNRINDSDYIKSLEQITDQIDEIPKGFKFLISRLKALPEFKSLIDKYKNEGGEQTGEGKKKKKIVLVKTTKPNPEETEKKSPFKFVLWERI